MEEGRAKPVEPEPEDEVETVEPLTVEQLEAIQQEAFQEAYDKGFQAGHQEGINSGATEIATKSQHLQHIIQSLADPLQAVDDTVREELLALSLAVARQIVRRELRQDPEQVVAVVREALGALPSAARNISIHLHPEDATLVRDSLAVGEGDGENWRLAEDLTLTRGGCRVESNTSRIDASVEKRLNSVVAELMGGTRSDDQPEQ